MGQRAWQRTKEYFGGREGGVRLEASPSKLAVMRSSPFFDPDG